MLTVLHGQGRLSEGRGGDTDSNAGTLPHPHLGLQLHGGGGGRLCP